MMSERQKRRSYLKNTVEYAERKARFLQRKREYLQSLIEVAVFDSNDEMTIRKMPRHKVARLEVPHKVISDQTDVCYKVGKEMSGHKFIENL